MADLPDPVAIGVVVSPHGVRGSLRVRPTGDGRHLRADVRPVIDGQRRRIVESRATGRGFVVELGGVEGREAAEALRGKDLVLDRSELDTPEEGEFYVGDLVGLSAETDGGDPLGVIVDVLDNGGTDVLVIRGSEDVFVPFTYEHVPEVGPDRIVVRPPRE